MFLKDDILTIQTFKFSGQYTIYITFKLITNYHRYKKEAGSAYSKHFPTGDHFFLRDRLRANSMSGRAQVEQIPT